MNYESQPLQMHEIRAMRAESAVMERVITSYRLMLDFYGMRLVSSETGVVDRCLPPRNYAARYNHLVRECDALTGSDNSQKWHAKRVASQLLADLADAQVSV
jgi:S1-C subfamily serine protease